MLLARGINAYFQRSFSSFDDTPKYTSDSVWELLTQDNEILDGVHTNAIPFLIEHLRRNPSRFSKALDSLRGKNSTVADWLGRLPSAVETDEYRKRAALYLAHSGPAAKPAMAVLLNIVADSEESQQMRETCGYSLCELDGLLPQYTDEISKLLLRHDVVAKQFAAEMLGLIGPKAKAAVPALLLQTTNAYTGCAVAAAFALWKIDRQTNTAIGVLTNALPGQTLIDQIGTLRRLRELAGAASPAAQAVVPLLTNTQSSVRAEAERCLAEINPAELEKAIADLNSKAPQLIEELMHNWEISSPPTSRFANILILYGDEARIVVPRLVRIIESTNELRPRIINKIDAARVLGEIGREARDAVPALLWAATNYSDWTVAPFLNALGEIGPDATNAVPLLEQVIGDPKNFYTGFAASEALLKIFPGNSKATAFLTSAESSTSFDYSSHEYIALWKARVVSESPLPALMKCIERNEARRTVAVERLGELGAEAKPAMPLIEKWLSPTNSLEDRLAAALALRRIDVEEFKRSNLPGTLGVPRR